MNKQAVVVAVAVALGVSQANARAALGAVLAAIGEGLATDGVVALDGFGRFNRVDKPAQPGRRIGGRVVDVPARTAVSFHASPTWRRELGAGLKPVVGAV
jgi:nucleoid DNA-binding protein